MKGPAAIRPAPPGVEDLLRVHDAFPERYPHLLVSGKDAGWGFDILFASPRDPLVLHAGASRSQCARFFSALDACSGVARASEAPDTALPFLFGHFLYLSYELVGAFESRVTLTGPADVPLAWLQGFDGAIIKDWRSGAVTVTGRDTTVVEGIEEDLRRMPDPRPWPSVTVEHVEHDPPEAYRDGVRDIHDYILAGDIFQANLSRSYRGRLASKTRAAALFDSLRRHNPAPFSAIARLGETLIASASPERLLRCRGRVIMTQPIAGTRARLSDMVEDEGAQRDLRADPKERAEHLMLVDLERNDLGRVCVAGSIRVSHLMRIESYATVHHLVSDIEGTLRAEVTLSDVIRALFPGGSITGCPKIRCVEILGLSEHGSRGAYTGSLGYINERGDTDLNILIRTLVVRGREIGFRVGAGIVADSDPMRELRETEAKAAGLLRALGCGT